MTAKRFLMSGVVSAMGWMSRHAGSIARPMVRWLANREVIACGVRGQDDTVCIIYSPQSGRTNYRVVSRQEGQWLPAESAPVEDFASGLVRQVRIPNAKVDDRYRVLARHPNGRTISSPVIQIKEYTNSLSTLVVTSHDNGRVQICWPRLARSAAMLYFLTVGMPEEPALVGVYTRERCWNYPALSVATLSIGMPHPPSLVPETEYLIQVVVVDFDGWVGSWFRWHGTLRNFRTLSTSSSS